MTYSKQLLQLLEGLESWSTQELLQELGNAGHEMEELEGLSREDLIHMAKDEGLS